MHESTRRHPTAQPSHTEPLRKIDRQTDTSQVLTLTDVALNNYRKRNKLAINKHDVGSTDI